MLKVFVGAALVGAMVCGNVFAEERSIDELEALSDASRIENVDLSILEGEEPKIVKVACGDSKDIPGRGKSNGETREVELVWTDGLTPHQLQAACLDYVEGLVEQLTIDHTQGAKDNCALNVEASTGGFKCDKINCSPGESCRGRQEEEVLYGSITVRMTPQVREEGQGESRRVFCSVDVQVAVECTGSYRCSGCQSCGSQP